MLTSARSMTSFGNGPRPLQRSSPPSPIPTPSSRSPRPAASSAPSPASPREALCSTARQHQTPLRLCRHPQTTFRTINTRTAPPRLTSRLTPTLTLAPHCQPQRSTPPRRRTQIPETSPHPSHLRSPHPPGRHRRPFFSQTSRPSSHLLYSPILLRLMSLPFDSKRKTTLTPHHPTTSLTPPNHPSHLQPLHSWFIIRAAMVA